MRATCGVHDAMLWHLVAVTPHITRPLSGFCMGVEGWS